MTFSKISGQKSLHILRRSPQWAVVQRFLETSEPEYTFPRSLTSDDRDTVRQIAQHFDCKFKVITEGNEKEIKIFKPDYSVFETIEAEQSSKQQQVEELKDDILRLQLCLSLAQKTLSRDQAKIKFLTRETEIFKKHLKAPLDKMLALKLEHSKKKIPDDGICSACDKSQVANAVYPCSHIFCKECACKFLTERECGACSSTVDGQLPIEQTDEPEAKRPRYFQVLY